MHRTRIKICGITRPQDAQAAAVAGADAIGIVLHAGIKRSVSLADARKIIKALPPFVAAIGLFVDDDVQSIRAAAAELQLAAVQLHGNETLETIQSLYPIPLIKAIHVDSSSLGEQLHQFQQISGPSSLIGYVMDAAHGGGSGIANDWDVLRRHIGDLARFPYWAAAGGLTPQNVGEVVRMLRPWAVDVSSGVEANPREKSEELIRAFIAAVRAADEIQ